MKLKLFLLTFPFLFCHLFCLAQNNCDYNNVKKLEKDYAKNKKKTIKKYDGKGNLAYAIAECYHENNDSTCLKWYYNAIEQLKKDYSKEKDKSKKATKLFNIGKCYYYIGDFKQAEVYFHKSIKAKYPDPIAFYYLGVCLKNQNKCNEAIVELKNYKKEIADAPGVDALIKECLTEIEKQK